MSIQNLLNTQTYAGDRRPSAGRGKTAETSFQDMLAKTAAEGSPKVRRLYRGADIAFSGSWGEQEVHVQYTAGSTPEDPVFRIFGTSSSGDYDFTRHIRDIDPSNASYAELAALQGHLRKTGAYQSARTGVLPTGIDPCDVTVKEDYLDEIRRFQADRRVSGPDKAAHCAELLALYQPYASGAGASQSAPCPDHSAFMKDGLIPSLADFRSGLLDKMKLAKEKEEDQEAWDKLMEYLDAWIESLREEADVRRIARAHAALAALQADAESDRPDLGGYLLGQLEALIA